MFSSTADLVLPLPLLHGVKRPQECASCPEQEVAMVSARQCQCFGDFWLSKAEHVAYLPGSHTPPSR